MKKLLTLVFVFIFVFGLTGCGSSGESHTIEIIIPAGSTEAYVYSEEELSPHKDTLKISAGAGISTAEVVVKPVESENEHVYGPATLKQNAIAEMVIDKGAWFKIGVGIQNPSDRNITVAVKVEDVDIRIE